MKCLKRQFENRYGAKFCLKCGGKLELQCSQCGQALPIEAMFSDECGYKLGAPKEAPCIDYSEPQSDTPKFLADEHSKERMKFISHRSNYPFDRKRYFSHDRANLFIDVLEGRILERIRT